MAETIGWGDDRPPRPHRRALIRSAGVVGALAVAAVVLVPVVQRHRAGGDAAWLQRQWATQAAVVDARSRLVATAFVHAGLADAGRYASVVLAADREAADRLASMLRQVRGRSVTGNDVRRAVTAVVRSLSAETSDVRAAAIGVSGPGFDDPLSVSTARLVDAADRAVAAVVRAHHVRPAKPRPVTLAAASADLSVLLRPTDLPARMRLVVATGTSAALWDLRTGRSTTLALTDSPGGIGLTPLRDGVVVGGDGGYQLLPLDGRSPRRLPAADAYLPAGDGVWRVFDGRARPYDADLTPVGDWRRLPLNDGYAVASSADALVLQQPDGRTLAWWPDSGRTVHLPDVCAADIVGTDVRGAAVSFVYADCRHSHLSVLDARTGSVRTLHAPAGDRLEYQLLALSRDGRRVAAAVVPATAAPGDVDAHQRVAVIDTGTGRTQVLPGSDGMDPEGWSADGDILVLAQVTSPPGSTSAFPLTYWHVGDAGLHSIRIDNSFGFSGLAVLP